MGTACIENRRIQYCADIEDLQVRFLHPRIFIIETAEAMTKERRFKPQISGVNVEFRARADGRKNVGAQVVRIPDDNHHPRRK